MAAIAALVLTSRRFYFWLRPVRIVPTVQMFYGDPLADTMGAEVTNRTSSPVYIEKCVVRGTYSNREIIRTHLRNPFCKPSIYPNIWYQGPVYDLLRSPEPVRLDAMDKKTFSKTIAEHPLNALHTPLLVVIVTLTSGRRVRSPRIFVPGTWKFIGQRHMLRAIISARSVMD